MNRNDMQLEQNSLSTEAKKPSNQIAHAGILNRLNADFSGPSTDEGIKLFRDLIISMFGPRTEGQNMYAIGDSGELYPVSGQPVFLADAPSEEPLLGSSLSQLFASLVLPPAAPDAETVHPPVEAIGSETSRLTGNYRLLSWVAAANILSVGNEFQPIEQRLLTLEELGAIAPSLATISAVELCSHADSEVAIEAMAFLAYHSKEDALGTIPSVIESTTKLDLLLKGFTLLMELDPEIACESILRLQDKGVLSAETLQKLDTILIQPLLPEPISTVSIQDIHTYSPGFLSRIPSFNDWIALLQQGNKEESLKSFESQLNRIEGQSRLGLVTSLYLHLKSSEENGADTTLDILKQIDPDFTGMITDLEETGILAAR